MLQSNGLEFLCFLIASFYINKNGYSIFWSRKETLLNFAKVWSHYLTVFKCYYAYFVEGTWGLYVLHFFSCLLVGWNIIVYWSSFYPRWREKWLMAASCSWHFFEIVCTHGFTTVWFSFTFCWFYNSFTVSPKVFLYNI